MPLPKRFCNLDRLLHAMKARGIDGIVATGALNVFYLSGFVGMGHKADEPRPYAVVLSRHAPDHPIFVVADYYLSTFLTQPSWIEDIRPFRAVMMPLDMPAKRSDIDRFIPRSGAGTNWLEQSRQSYAFDMGTAMRGALRDLSLEKSRVAFDDMGYGTRLAIDGMQVADGYDALMFARTIKTETELQLLGRATQLNEAAITRTTREWRRGMTWRELSHVYTRSIAELGGFVRDPGGMVWAHPRGSESAIMVQAAPEDEAVEPGASVMFDCHGTVDLYCWDGGKTWIADGEPTGVTKRNADATARVAEALLDAMRPGARVSGLQAHAREVYRKSGLSNADDAVVFFHGLGLSHMDLEQSTADGKPNGDWMLEEGMVVPMHLLVPGGERERYWLEEVVVVGKNSGRPLFSWGFGPI